MDDVKLQRVGHIAIAVYDGQLLLVWGGYMVSWFGFCLYFIVSLLIY